MAACSRKKTALRMLCTLAALLLAFTACKPQAATPSAAVLTQKPAQPGRTPITVLVKYAFTIDAFEQAVEEKFPDIDIVQVGNYTRDMGIAEYESRLVHHDLTDIVMTWPLDVGEPYWEENLLDLSGMDFTSHYNLSMLNNISRGGKLYYLPGPSQVRGIVYNKTLFQEKGWQVPTDYEGFVALCNTIEQSGMRSIQLGFANSEVLDTAFIGYNYASSFSKPQDVQWIADYNSGAGSFGEHFGPALDLFQQMIDDGIWKPADLNVNYSDRESMLFTRRCAMVEDSALMARIGHNLTGTTDEFALMPFFNPGESGDWARLYMVCYVGLNKQLAEPKNEKKYELVKKLMDYISTLEGQTMLAADTDAMFSSLIGMPPPDVPEIEALLPALNHGRYAVFPQLQNAQGALREGLAGMVRGELTKQQVIALVDAQNKNPVAATPPQKLGTATADFTLTETGDLVSDALRAWGGSDIALFLDNGKDGRYNGRGISARLYRGDTTTLDVDRILPDLKHGETGVLWKAQISGSDLLKTLEYSVTVDNNSTGWFYYFSGLRMTYDPTADPGSRIQNITLENGKPVDLAALYSIVIMEHCAPEELLQNCEKTQTTVTEVVQNYIKEQGTISPSGDGRFQLPT